MSPTQLEPVKLLTLEGESDLSLVLHACKHKTTSTMKPILDLYDTETVFEDIKNLGDLLISAALSTALELTCQAYRTASRLYLPNNVQSSAKRHSLHPIFTSTRRLPFTSNH
jgi:hypothetical protein